MQYTDQEAFITDFHTFEIEARVFEKCLDESGFAWWDIARYAVQFALVVELGFQGRSNAVVANWWQRLPSLASRMRHFLTDAIAWDGRAYENVESLYVFGRDTPAIVKHLQARAKTSLAITKSRNGYESHACFGKQTVDDLTTLLAWRRRCPAIVAKQALDVSQQLQRNFRSQIDFSSIIIRKYLRHESSTKIWQRIFECLPSLSSTFIVNDDTLKTLIACSNSRGISTTEFQHAYAGKSHIAYSYPSVPIRMSTLPKNFLVYRDTKDITFPTNIVVDPSISSQSYSLSATRDIDVLIGGSPTRNDEAHAILRTLAAEGFSIAIKLHPAQTVTSSGFGGACYDGQVTVFEGGVDFVSLANRTKIYIPANPTSTTAFEAVEQGAELLVIDYNGVKASRPIDHLIARRTDTVDGIVESVRVLLARQGFG